MNAKSLGNITVLFSVRVFSMQEKNKPIHLTIKNFQVDLKTIVSGFSFIEDFHVFHKVLLFFSGKD